MQTSVEELLERVRALPQESKLRTLRQWRPRQAASVDPSNWEGVSPEALMPSAYLSSLPKIIEVIRPQALQSMQLVGQRLTELPARLDEMNRLRELNLSNNRIQDLCGLLDIPQLGTNRFFVLSLYDNPLTRVSPAVRRVLDKYERRVDGLIVRNLQAKGLIPRPKKPNTDQVKEDLSQLQSYCRALLARDQTLLRDSHKARSRRAAFTLPSRGARSIARGTQDYDLDQVARFINRVIALHDIDPALLKSRPRFRPGKANESYSDSLHQADRQLQTEIIHNCTQLSSALEGLLDPEPGLSAFKKQVPLFWPELLRTQRIADLLPMTPTEKQELLKALSAECARKSPIAKRQSTSPLAVRR